MAMVRFASTCDSPACRRSSEYVEWSRCRTCHKHVCNQCAEPFTAHNMDKHDSDSGADYEVLTVQCGDCLESGQADEFTDTESAHRVGYPVESPK